MRVLFLSNLYPWPLDHGSVQRVHHLLDGFCDRHRVTLVAEHRGGAQDAPPLPLASRLERLVIVDNADVLARTGGPWGLWRPLPQRLLDALVPGRHPLVRRWWSPRMVSLLADLRRSSDYDVVYAQRTPLAEMARAAGWPRIIVDISDLEAEALGRLLDHAGSYATRPLHRLDWRRLARYERALPSRFAHVVVCKDDDRAWLGGGPNVSVVPNGVATRDAVDPAKEEADHLVFVGTMGYEPNVDAAAWFMEAVMPEIRRRRPSAHFSIVGKDPAERLRRLHDGQACVVHGAVPDVTPYYEAAGVVVAPIRLGSGTRLKILEALMFGKALVATSIAIEGLDLRPGVDVDVADDPRAMADACVRLIEDPARRRQLAASGRARAIERYDWSRVNDAAERALLDTVGTPDAPASAPAFASAAASRRGRS